MASQEGVASNIARVGLPLSAFVLGISVVLWLQAGPMFFWANPEVAAGSAKAAGLTSIAGIIGIIYFWDENKK